MERMAYVIPIEEYDEKNGWRACIAKEGVQGYFQTDWFWGHDYDQACKIAEERNSVLFDGDLKEALMVVMSSMFPKRRKA
jgi:hypothetical protein